MKVEFHKNFIKNFNKRFSTKPKIKAKFIQKTKLFTKDPAHPTLKDHPLKGKKLGLRAFSITKDIRVVYYVKGDTAYLLDIGTHNQVYK